MKTWGAILTLMSLPVLVLTEISFIGKGPPPSVARPFPGTPWPQPNVWHRGDSKLTVLPANLTFSSNLDPCDIIIAAFDRMVARLLLVDALEMTSSVQVMYGDYEDYSDYEEEGTDSDGDNATVSLLTRINVHVKDEFCPWYPGLQMNEDYNITVQRSQVFINSSSAWGIVWGFETLTQLMFKENGQWQLNEGEIEDDAKFSHRGLMLDTSSHFYEVDDIKFTLDTMSMNKMNVFHWHIVGSHSFPFMTWLYPELASQGSFSPGRTYSIQNVHDIIEYARLRGIRVIPEFNTPSQTDSWFKSKPDLSSQCSTDNQTLTTSNHSQQAPRPIMDVSKSSLYVFLTEFFWEAAIHFQDQLIHTGMRDLDLTCWESNTDIASFMASQNITDYTGLLGYHNDQLQEILESDDKRAIIWQDIFEKGARISNRTLIQFWEPESVDGTGEHSHQDSTLHAALLAGHDIISSSCWDLTANQRIDDWQAFLQCNPFKDVPENYMSQILGGEATLWSEFVDGSNLLQTIWPRTAALAERLWGDGHEQDLETVAFRLDQHRCRMLKQGIPVPPIAPGFCSDNYNTDNWDPHHHQLYLHQQNQHPLGSGTEASDDANSSPRPDSSPDSHGESDFEEEGGNIESTNGDGENTNSNSNVGKSKSAASTPTVINNNKFLVFFFLFTAMFFVL